MKIIDEEEIGLYYDYEYYDAIKNLRESNTTKKEKLWDKVMGMGMNRG